MVLAGMITTDEDALICDFAETYRILDFRALPLRLAATLASGLPDDSRIKMRLSKTRVGVDTMILAGIADRVDMLRYMVAGEKKAPPSMVSRLESLGNEEEKKNKPRGFDSVEAFEKAYQKLLGR